MKYRRKPVERTIVDAIMDGGEYIVQVSPGVVERMSSTIFESQYEPVQRERVKKARKAKNKVIAAPVEPAP